MESTTNPATKSTVQLQSEALFPLAWREGVYQAIYRRRDIRRFRPDPIPSAILARLLDAAHHAPSAGFMQPWTFLVISE